MADLARIEERIDRVAVSTMEVSDALGGIRFQNMVEVMEFAKCMAIADTAVPKHLRGNVGMCLAVCVQALEWRFSPFAVANKSYVVNDRIGYESQLVHAVIEQRAPITGRLRHKFEGDGEERRCIVSATLRETGENLEYISPPFGKIQPKNSPLWKTKPDLQLYYNTSRDFCRAYFPDVLLGVYSAEELRDHVGPDNAKELNKPDVASRLKARGQRGFSSEHVERESRGGVIEESQSETEGTNPSKTPHDTTAQEKSDVTIESRATDAPRHPDQAKTVGDAQQGGNHASPAGKSGLAGEMPAPDSNSTDPALSPQDDAAKSNAPAAEDPPVSSAGQQSEPSAERPAPAADEHGGEDAHPPGPSSPSLPAGTLILYASALRRAQKKDSLKKYAAQFWNERGGWDKWRSTTDGETAAAIFNAFDKHFGDKDTIERELRELI